MTPASPTQLLIRPAAASDVPALVAFNCALASETERLHLDPTIVTAGVRGLLSAPQRGMYLVACRDGQVVGQLMLTFEWSDWRNGNYWWVQSVYVAPDARRQGVLRALFAELRRLAAESTDAVGLRLYVEDANAAAQDVYTRLGLSSAGYRVMQQLFDGHGE